MTGAGDPDDADLVAAEYVIGTLDGAERAAFAERLRGDDTARRALTAWEARLAGLADRVPTVPPPPRVWTAIEQALRTPPRRFEVIEGGGRRADPTPLVASRNRWRVAAVGLGSVAAALTAFIAVDRAGRSLAPPAPEGSYVAAINSGGDKPALLVRVDLSTRKVYVMPVAAKAPSGRSLELWYIGDDKTPRPMGLVDRGSATMAMPMPMPVDAAPSGGTFAVSVEPPGGSTTGGPTGPVVYSGQLVKE